MASMKAVSPSCYSGENIVPNPSSSLTKHLPIPITPHSDELEQIKILKRKRAEEEYSKYRAKS